MTFRLVTRVADIANQIIVDGETHDKNDMNDDDFSFSLKTNLSELCQIHDALIEDRSFTSQSRVSIDIARFRLCTLYAEHSMGLDPEKVAGEADVYRAIIGISMYLVQTIQSTKTSEMNSTMKHLDCTIQQSTLLLKILSFISSFSSDESTAALPSKYPILQIWIDEMARRTTNSWGNDEDTNMISFDPQELALEEAQLLRMANTPMPSESGRNAANHPNNGSMQKEASTSLALVARMSSNYLSAVTSDQSPSIQISMDHNGMLRLTGKQRNDWWAAMTPSSTVCYVSPTFTITSAVVHTEKNSNRGLSLSTIVLEVGNGGRQWWEVASSIIEQLKDLESLRGEVEKLWPQDQVERQISAAFNQAGVDTTMID